MRHIAIVFVILIAVVISISAYEQTPICSRWITGYIDQAILQEGNILRWQFDNVEWFVRFLLQVSNYPIDEEKFKLDPLGYLNHASRHKYYSDLKIRFYNLRSIHIECRLI